MVSYHTLDVDGVGVFYREAGDPLSPTVLLLHGFPSASHMFRDLIPELEGRYHVIAPDYPGFGQSSCPDRSEFDYTFDHVAETVGGFVDALGLASFALYVFDYGAPIGLRLAVARPDAVWAIVSQNGNCYREGLGEKWAARAAYWAHPTSEARDSYRSAFAPETIRHQYMDGTEPGRVGPDGYTLDAFYMARPGNDERQLDLIYDYRTNVERYTEFQAYLRESQVPLLAVWGRNDVSFVPAGAEAFRRDLPQAEVHLLDTGHFALETHAPEIGALMRDFLARAGGQAERRPLVN
ncbi:MAG: alpha/beta hydrolase [Atopobiaceae bacterium]|jgi:pimeloyl-ACP methyl ester carboxylesterase|nr:alpha/beta hydrolase [Atopobiaceae bacterium]